MITLGLMIGLLLTPLGVLYQDIGRSLVVFTQALFFLTPVIYPVPQAAFAAALIQLNPVTPLLTSTREWLTGGDASLLPSFIGVSVGTLVLLFLGWLIYRIAMPHLIARMSA
jgi:lipopolysaccharide transport system permease protein